MPPSPPISPEKRRERYLETLRDKMAKLYAYGEAKPPARQQLWHEITGFLEAGKVLSNITSEELPAFERMFGWRSADSVIQSDYGRAGIYSDAMLSEYRKLTDAMLEGLPDHSSPTPATAKDNVVKLDKRRQRNDG